MHLNVLPESGYTFVGLYINGNYVEGSYNNLSPIVNLKDYNEDVVIEAKFAKNISVVYKVTANGSSSMDTIFNNYGLNSLKLSGEISNIYNTEKATIVLGKDEFNPPVSMSDISLSQDPTGAFILTATVPYGTILNFKVIGSEDEMENFHFDGWYVNNNIVSRDSQIKVIAANDNNTTNEFVAKYSNSGSAPALNASAGIKLYSLENGALKISEYEYNKFVGELTDKLESVITVNGKLCVCWLVASYWWNSWVYVL